MTDHQPPLDNVFGYKVLFQPPLGDITDLAVSPPQAPSEARPTVPLGDRRDGLGYIYTRDIVLHVNVALATGRPLLIRGPSGSGKSSLARSVANVLGWRYYEEVITSRTRARDLLYRFDTLRRLSDAELGRLGTGKDSPLEREAHPWHIAQYVEPSVLWWAINRASAVCRGAPPEYAPPVVAKDPNKNLVAITDEATTRPAVVLLDEIDKADPDVPNDLLVALGSLEFQVEELAQTIRPDGMGIQPAGIQMPLLVLITTNGERELPPAFLRRCLILTLTPADEVRLVQIAQRRFGEPPDEYPDLFAEIAQKVVKEQESRSQDRQLLAASTAEYLDAIQACMSLQVYPHQPSWDAIANTTLWKQYDDGGP